MPPDRLLIAAPATMDNRARFQSSSTRSIIHAPTGYNLYEAGPRDYGWAFHACSYQISLAWPRLARETS